MLVQFVIRHLVRWMARGEGVGGCIQFVVEGQQLMSMNYINARPVRPGALDGTGGKYFGGEIHFKCQDSRYLDTVEINVGHR